MNLDHRHRHSRSNAAAPPRSHPFNQDPPSASSAFQTNETSLPNPWEDPQNRPLSRVRSMNQGPYFHSETPDFPPNIASRSSISFPQPHFTQPRGTDSSLHVPTQSLQHRHSTSDFRSRPQPPIPTRPERFDELSYQRPSQHAHDPQFSRDNTIQPSLSSSSFDLDDMLRQFQEGKLNDEHQEWHKLVLKEAQEALGKKEVRRQSVIFEIIKGEREYVADLELVQQLFIDGLCAARPRVIPETKLSGFIKDVFGNLPEILALHEQLLNTLFERQREQHPLVQTVADVILDKAVRTEFRSAYETYIKHYPLAESYHRKELKHNGAYEQFIQTMSHDSRVRKRDLITFLSRPVTRLPRLSLLLEETLKSTEKDFEHPDLEALPLVLGILRDCIKSTQPGIEAAESKVKFWALCESLHYQKGEIIDMDLYDQSRTLVHSSSVARRVRTDAGFHEWDDLVASLLDNYFLLTKEVKGRESSIKRNLISRPLYLSFLRLGSFNDAPEARKEKREGGLLGSLRSDSIPALPFTIFHSWSRSTRRYTLYAASDAQRQKWKDALSEAIALHRLREDSGKWFEPQNITNSFFHVPSQVATPFQGPESTGRITSAVPFAIAQRNFLAVGCPRGIFVSVAGHEDFKRVLHYSNPSYMAALQTVGNTVINRFIVHSEPEVVSYSLELLARLALGQTTPEILDASMEKIGVSESNITFCKSIQIGGRGLVIYASKRWLSTSLTLQIVEAVGQAEMENMTPKGNNARVLSFKPFGEPGFVPRDAFDVTALTKNIAICTQDGIVIADPTNLARSAVAMVPDLQDAASDIHMSTLKDRLKDAKPLGLVRVDDNELLLIYDSIGYYITKRGVPSRSCGYIRWEVQATGFAHRGNHILLVSSQFIEVRNVNTGRIAQVIEGDDMRLMYSGHTSNDKEDRVLLAMRGGRNDKDGSTTDKIVELVETVEYVPRSAVSDVWDEWDM